jgi:hypothetical protein
MADMPNFFMRLDRVHKILAGNSGVACAWADRQILELVEAHLEELEDAWRRGCISEHDRQGGTRSNRNVEVLILVRKLLGAKTS